MFSGDRAYMVKEDEGQAIWFAGALMVLKAASDQTEDRFAFMDQQVPADYAAPLHVHHEEDEAWFVLEGEITFYCGERSFVAGKGAWVFLPKDIPHSFRVNSAGGRLLTFTAPASFSNFVKAAGEAAPRPVLPPPGPLDVDRLAAIAVNYGIEILGPPPA